MAYRLRMSGEIRDWLAGLPGSDPAAALLVGQALTALIGEGDRLGPPLVVSLARSTRPADLPEALDRSYQDRLGRLHIVRRLGADAATLTREIQIQVTDLELLETRLSDQRRQALDAGDSRAAAQAADELAAARTQLAELRRLLPGVSEAEQRLIGQSQLLKSSRRATPQRWPNKPSTRPRPPLAGRARDRTPPAPQRPTGSGRSSARSSGSLATRTRRKACWSCGPARPARVTRSASSSRSSRRGPRC
jgi:hypothetical protein